MKSIRVFIAGGLSALTLFAGQGVAAEYSWKSPVSGDFDAASSWTPTGVPGENDTAIFDLGSSAGYTISRNSDYLKQLKIGNDTVVFERSQLLMLNTDVPSIQVGLESGDVANVTLTDRIWMLGNQVLLGEAEGTQSDVTLDDATLSISGLTPSANRQLVIGGGGAATLTLLEGRVEGYGKTIIGRDAASDGSFTVRGSRSVYEGIGTGVTVGQRGNGSLTVANLARADITGDLIVGEFANSEGRITVEGESGLSTAASGNAYMTSATIGAAGKGALDVKSGSSAYLAGPLVIGRDEGSEGAVTVEGAQSELRPLGGGAPPKLGLTVGDGGVGTMDVRQGATALFGNTVTLGKAATGNGHITVDGSGSRLASANVGGESIDKLIVGESGTGKFTVSGGADVDLIGTEVEIASSEGSHGLLEVKGAGSTFFASTLEIGKGGTGELNVANGGRVVSWSQSIRNDVGGTIRLQNGLLDDFFASSLEVQNAGKLINNGTVKGNVTNLPGGVVSGSGVITGTLSAEGGTIAPGNSPGTLLTGDLELDSVTLQIEMNVADGVAGEIFGWDLLQAQGTALITGSLEIELKSISLQNEPGDALNFDPLQDYSWTILNAEQGISGFPLVNMSVDTSGFSNPFSGHFFVTHLGNTLALNYAVPEPGTLSLLIVGAVGVIALGKRRRF